MLEWRVLLIRISTTPFNLSTKYKKQQRDIKSQETA